MGPNFLIIGSQKAGTTSLYEVLRKHPQIYLPEVKELNFFFKESEFKRGLDYYRQRFSGANGEQAVGEASPGYICHPECPQRICDAFPDIKLILTIRNPIDRAYSQYWDSRRKLAETRSFEQAYRDNFSEEYALGSVGYFSRGFYLKYINSFLNYFDRDQLLVLEFSGLRRSPEDFFNQCFNFLGVDAASYEFERNGAHNQSVVWNNIGYRLLFENPQLARLIPFKLRRKLRYGEERAFEYPQMKKQLRAELVERYRKANDALADFLGLDLSHWNAL